MWVNKYQPKTLSKVAGQNAAILHLKRFIASFPKGKHGLILYGPSGCGKTSMIYALSNESKYEVLEVNSSDVRNKANVELKLREASKQASLFASKKIILVDEIDNLSGRSDRGGIQSIIDILKGTKFPFIFTANDPYSSKLKTLRKNCEMLELKGLSEVIITNHLSEIIKKEVILCDYKVLKKLASSVNGDLRAAITDLQMMAQNRKEITEKDLKFWGREQEENIFKVLKVIFKSFDTNAAVNAIDSITENPDMLILWLDQSLPLEYRTPIELKRAYDILSDIDIFNHRIIRWQHWRFLWHCKILLSAGIQQAKDQTNPKFILHKRPELLTKIFIGIMKLRKYKSLGEQVSPILHASSRNLRQSFWPYYNFIQQHNKPMAMQMNKDLDL